MSEAIVFPVRFAAVRTVQGMTLWAASGGLGACGGDDTKPASEASSTSSMSTEGAQTLASGQSGTEYDPNGGVIGDRPSCPCGWLENPLRGTVLEVVGHIEGADGRPVRLGSVRLRVEQLLGDTSGLETGSEITSPWFGELPCFYGCASVAVGDEVLAFYRFPRACSEIAGDDNCDNGRTIPGNIALTPWADRLVLAQLASGDLTLSVDELSLLQSPECTAQLGNVHDRLGGPKNEDGCYERVAPSP